MSTQTNPYQTPAIAPVVLADASTSVEPIYFQGSMTLEEGQQADQLMRGKKLATKTDRKMLLHGILLTLALFAWMSWEAVAYGELDLFLAPAIQVLLLAVVFIGVWWSQKNRDQRHAELHADKRGVFTHVGGSVHATGVDYLADDFPIHFDWEDFVGCRIADDAALLYVNFPREMSFLAASYFVSADQWQTAKAMIQRHVPTIRASALRAPRQMTQRMTHIAVGTQELNQQKWPEAIAEFDAVLAIEPSNAQAIRGRLIALMAAQDLDAAISAAEYSVKHEVNDRATRLTRTSVLIAKERFEEALPDLNWLVDHSPNNFEPLRDRGLVNLKLGRCENSLADLSRAVELNADDALTLNNRGATLIELGRPDEAIVDLERALQIDPTFVRPKYHLDRARKLLCQP